jgi:hypothetical protein
LVGIVIQAHFCFMHVIFNWQDLGDLGLVAKASRSSQSMMRKPDPLTITKVFNTFQQIAKVLSTLKFYFLIPMSLEPLFTWARLTFFLQAGAGVALSMHLFL